MINEPKPLTICRNTPRPTSQQITAFQQVPSSFVADALGGGGHLDIGIKPLLPVTKPMAGPALSVANQPGDILASMAALNFIQPGDIVVATNSAHQGYATAGDRLCGMMKNNKARGFISDGPLRDRAGLMAVGLPVWATGFTPGSPFSNGPGAVGLPIQIGGQTVQTGDMIIADDDGVVVVPFAQIDQTIANLADIQQQETKLDQEVENGLKIPPGITALLNSDQVDFRS